LEVYISPEDLNKLKEVKNKRPLLLPNHPSEDDPYVIFELAKLLGQSFYTVAAREVFDWHWGLRGKLFQWTGTYSLIRGTSDRDSFKTTKEILIRGERPLVIFIEGEISNENDTLIPFEPVVVQLAFWAQEELVEKENSGEVNLVPLALKYFYKGNVDKVMDKAISGLEAALKLKRLASDDIFERLMEVAMKVLSLREKQLNLPDNAELTLDERIKRVKEKMLNRLENFLDISVPLNMSLLDRTRVIRNQIDKVSYHYKDPAELTDYERNNLKRNKKLYASFYNELDRLANFIVLRDGYIAANKRPERFIELIKRLEKEIYGRIKISHPRECVVQVGEALNLKTLLEDYKNNKKPTLQKLASQLELNTNTMLQNAKSRF